MPCDIDEVLAYEAAQKMQEEEGGKRLRWRAH